MQLIEHSKTPRLQMDPITAAVQLPLLHDPIQAPPRARLYSTINFPSTLRVCAATHSTCLHVVAKRLFSPGLVAHPQCASNAAGQQRVSTRHRRSTAWWVHTKTGFRNNMHRRSAAWCVHTTTGFRTNITALKIALLQSWLTRKTKYSSPLHGIQQHSCK